MWKRESSNIVRPFPLHLCILTIMREWEGERERERERERENRENREREQRLTFPRLAVNTIQIQTQHFIEPRKQKRRKSGSFQTTFYSADTICCLLLFSSRFLVGLSMPGKILPRDKNVMRINSHHVFRVHQYLLATPFFTKSIHTDKFMTFRSGYNLPIETYIYGANGGTDRAIAVNAFYIAVAVFGLTAAILGTYTAHNEI
jgi:hypothetical protein